MAYYKEIVTKAVIGKGKKATNDIREVTVDEVPNTVLGCWVINHNFNGYKDNSNILVKGSYDVNIWYSYDNNSKTKVYMNTIEYNDLYNVPINNNVTLNDKAEIIVNSISDPSVISANIVNGNIELNVRKEMGIDVIGDTKVRVNVIDNIDDYMDVESNIEISEDELNQIDNEIKEDYLN